MRAALLVSLSLVAACSEPNPLFCCLTAEDCAANGLSNELRPCEDGLSCVANTCKPSSCASEGCTAAAPTCDVATDMCVGCTSSADCDQYVASPICGDSGACVACVESANCGAATPVCDANACRTCRADSECASGACGDDGACIEESSVIYLATNGVDVAPCSQDAPCLTAEFVGMQLSATREHIVFAPGTYVGTYMLPQAPATRVVIHGNGATLQGGNGDYPTINSSIPIEISDLVLVNPLDGEALRSGMRADVRGCKLRGRYGIGTVGNLTVVDTQIESTWSGISGDANVTLDRVRISGGQLGIYMLGGVLDFTNVLIHDTRDVGMRFENARGVIRSTTIANTGLGVTTAFGVDCDVADIRFVDSIIWSSPATTRLPVANCQQLESTIAGPSTVPNGLAMNPQFVGEYTFDFRLAAAALRAM